MKSGDTIRVQQPVPYKNKAAFVMATTGRFHEEIYLSTAWDVYSATITSFNRNPAILYKIADLSRLESSGKLNKLADKKTADGMLKSLTFCLSGRLYGPGEFHAWNVNQAWLLGQIHFARAFVILSPLNSRYVMRKYHPDVFSALAKEVATVIKAGYTVRVTEDAEVMLEPSLSAYQNNMTIFDLDLSEEEIKSAILSVNTAIEAYCLSVKASLSPLIQKLQETEQIISNEKLEHHLEKLLFKQCYASYFVRWLRKLSLQSDSLDSHAHLVIEYMNHAQDIKPILILLDKYGLLTDEHFESIAKQAAHARRIYDALVKLHRDRMLARSTFSVCMRDVGKEEQRSQTRFTFFQQTDVISEELDEPTIDQKSWCSIQ
jgi:hypothetical protein